jgi:hypothetical protein
MPLTDEQIDEFERMAVEAADREIAAYRKLLGLEDLEVEPE